jgi:hypothetical protein
MASLKEASLFDLVDLNNIILIYHKKIIGASEKNRILVESSSGPRRGRGAYAFSQYTFRQYFTIIMGKFIF